MGFEMGMSWVIGMMGVLGVGGYDWGRVVKLYQERMGC